MLLVVVGAQGSGKSTLLQRLSAAAIPPGGLSVLTVQMSPAEFLKALGH